MSGDKSAFPPPALPGSGSWVESCQLSSQSGIPRLPKHCVDLD
jgi:hypothetical protein